MARQTTLLLMGHMPEPLARLAESYIMCPKGIPGGHARAGHWELTDNLESQKDLDNTLKYLCAGGSIEMIELVLRKGATDYYTGLLSACIARNLDAAVIMFNHSTIGQNYIRSCMPWAASDFAIARLLISHLDPTEGWEFDQILVEGARQRNMTMVTWAIGRGAGDWDDGLQAACQGGDRGIILLMLHLGGSLDSGLFGACGGNNIRLAREMIRRGATDFYSGLDQAVGNDCIDTANLMISHGANHFCTLLEGLGQSQLKTQAWLLSKENRCSECGRRLDEHNPRIENDVEVIELD